MILAAVIIRARWLVVWMAVVAGIIGLAVGLLTARTYRSEATFIPEASEGSSSGLALAAMQFGVRIPSGAEGWSPAVYVGILRSRALLHTIAHEPVVVAEEGNRKVLLIDLLNIRGSTPAKRGENAYIALREIVSATEVRTIGAVRVSVLTKWPSVSHALAERLLMGINAFILETRKSQATAERVFAERQASDLERSLRSSEDALKDFMERNRVIGPAQKFEQDRLLREVSRNEAIYSAMLQSVEEAKIRQVRDTPVLTVLEPPRLPATGESRLILLRAVIGGVTGGFIAVLFALGSFLLAGARREQSADSREFFAALTAAVPAFLKRSRV